MQLIPFRLVANMDKRIFLFVCCVAFRELGSWLCNRLPSQGFLAGLRGCPATLELKQGPTSYGAAVDKIAQLAQARCSDFV